MRTFLPDMIDRWQQAISIWLPQPFFGIALLFCTIIAAILFWLAVHRILKKIVANRWRFIDRLLDRIRRVGRFAIILLALGTVLPAAGFPAETAELVSKFLFVGFVLLIGWCASIAIELGSEFYLRGYRIDVEDNLLARKHVTQIRILKRAINTLIVIISVASALMIFQSVRQYGISLLASAGAAGIVLGFAARPLLANLIAGVQIAITQPIRVDDAVVVNGEWGWIEEITSTYVVVKIWDWRRLILPLSYFIEQPFQNWTRQTAAIIGTVFLYVDYVVPIERIREKMMEIVKATPLWDGNVVVLQVTDFKTDTVELRILVSSPSSPKAFDLRCHVREQLLLFLQNDYPETFPRRRVSLERENPDAENPQALAPDQILSDAIPDMDRR